MAADSSPLRPTKSVVRKALRDILRPVVVDLVILELFAGTAMVSEELIQEGAKKAFAVDTREPPEPFPEGIEWFQRDVKKFLNHGPPEPVGLVFMDPPYDASYTEELVREISTAAWLKSEGIIAVETGRYEELPDNSLNSLITKRNRRYGNTRLWIFQERLSNES